MFKSPSPSAFQSQEQSPPKKTLLRRSESSSEEETLKVRSRCLRVVTRKERKMTVPTIIKIVVFFFYVSSGLLLRYRQAVPPATPAEIVPINIKDIHILLYSMKNLNIEAAGLPQFLILLITIQSFCQTTSQIRIPCYFHSNSWQPNNTFILNSRQLLVSTRYGFDMLVDRNDATVSQSIAVKGSWDPSQIHALAFFLNSGSRVLNLGPQTGLEAIVMGKIIGPQGKLFLFEPNPTSHSILKKNIYLNDLEDITRIYQLGASDVQMEKKLIVEPQNTGAAYIAPMKALPIEVSGRQIEEFVVRVDLVDNVLSSEPVIDFVLIDVEKLEVEALLGMKRLIERSRDVVLMVEWQYAVNPNRNQAKTIRCLEWLSRLDFRFYRYKESQKNKCQIGQFQRIGSTLSLLQLGPLDIIIAPSHINPNQLK